jgi:hypothetical protein
MRVSYYKKREISPYESELLQKERNQPLPGFLFHHLTPPPCIYNLHVAIMDATKEPSPEIVACSLDFQSPELWAE